MNAARRKLNSWKQAQQQVGDILAALNADPALMLAAASNPLLALQDLGYEVGENVQQEFEDRIRFEPADAQRLRSLREEIFKIAGEPFDLNSPEAVSKILSRLVNYKSTHSLSVTEVAPPLPTSDEKIASDPLEKLRGLHPIIEPLLEYRHLDASTPRFASREVYDEIRQRKRAAPLTRLKARLQQPS